MVFGAYVEMLCYCARFLPNTFSVVRRAKSSFNYDISKTLEKMPFEKKHQTEARVGYEIRKERNQKEELQNKFVKLVVVGNGAHGCPRSVHLCTDNRQYLFNCGEGTQRLASDTRIKLTRMPHVFITYPSWENVSGLIGMALTLQGIGIPELTIHGPKTVENVFSATNRFVALRKIKVYVSDIRSDVDFNDGAVNIRHVLLHSSNDGGVNKKLSDSALDNQSANNNKIAELISEFNDESDDVDYYGHLNKRDRSPPAKKFKGRSQSLSVKTNDEPKRFVVCYICKTKKLLGTLLIENCVKHGVPCGPLLGQLKKGEDIVLPNGRQIKSSDVKLPDVPGATIIVVECPSEDYLDPLLKNPAFYNHQSSDSEDVASVVVHFTNSKILQHPKYKEWINRFPPETKHLIIGDSNVGFGSIEIHRHQFKLNMLCPEIFPLLPNAHIPKFPRIENADIPSGHEVVPKQEEMPNRADIIDILRKDDSVTFRDLMFVKCVSNPIIYGEMFSEVSVRPQGGHDYVKKVVLKWQELMQELEANSELMSEIAKLKEDISKIKLTDEEYPKILFLGTGSSQPSKVRNTSGILLFLDEESIMLLDCGEGTWGQLFHFFGPEKTSEILLRLNVIYVSHLHADHHMGFVTLLKQRVRAYDEKCALEQSKGNPPPQPLRPIRLLAPIQITKWLHVFNNDFEKISHLYEIVPNGNLADASITREKYEECLKLLNLESIRTTLVDHCPNAYGIAITHQSGWKLTYSGDTKPCDDLVEIGANSDILIHEATMDDSMLKSAVMKLHSTTGQAIHIGKKMKARFIILTHFSQRYSHLPVFHDTFTDEVGVAFDNMLVSLKHLPILSKLKPSLKLMFESYYKVMLDRIMMTQLKARTLSRRESQG